MTLQEAKSIARHLGLTLRKVRSGDYRVNFELQFSSKKCGREVLELIVGYASLNHIVIYERVIPVVQSLC